KTDDYYHPESDSGIHPYDADLHIPWPVAKEHHILSEKDEKLPLLTELTKL
ncbi:MAG: dTDP-4-dehydrorhamnose 3,5-epimerase family protein, partial [Candidatus Marinimicrobia bacterium]|nr:dTDP-4-dehydrorhamnose 3,5-epimerase family protein [Candidatus Neomarinimicrobiota bacterium]